MRRTQARLSGNRDAVTCADVNHLTLTLAANTHVVRIDFAEFSHFDHAGKLGIAHHRLGQVFAVPVVQHRLVVEEIDLRWATCLEQVDHPFRFGRVIRKAGVSHATASPS